MYILSLVQPTSQVRNFLFLKFHAIKIYVLLLGNRYSFNCWLLQDSYSKLIGVKQCVAHTRKVDELQSVPFLPETSQTGNVEPIIDMMTNKL